MSDPGGFRGLTVAAFESRMADEMRRLITRYGGQPLVAPAMREIPLEDNAEALRFGEHLVGGQFDLLILLTGVGTRILLDVLRTRVAPDAIKAALSRTCLVARGPKPLAVLRELGLTPDITVPEPNTWHDIVQALDASKRLTGLRIAVQEYGVVNRELLQALQDRGAQVSPVPVYRWALPEDTAPLRQVLQTLLAGDAAALLITNAVQVDHVVQLLEPDRLVERLRQTLRQVVVASIGPTASERLRSHALPVDLEPSHSKMGLLVKETSEQAHRILERKRRGDAGTPAAGGRRENKGK